MTEKAAENKVSLGIDVSAFNSLGISSEQDDKFEVFDLDEFKNSEVSKIEETKTVEKEQKKEEKKQVSELSLEEQWDLYSEDLDTKNLEKLRKQIESKIEKGEDIDEKLLLKANIKSSNKESQTVNKAKTEDTKPDTDIESPISALTAHAAMLVESGVLNEFNTEEFEKLESTEQKINFLIEAHRNEIVAGIEGYIESLPEPVKKLIVNYNEGVPLDESIRIYSQLQRYEAIDEDLLKDNENLQKQVVYDYYKQTTSFSDAEIQKRINRDFKNDDGVELALEAKEKLIEIQKEEEERLKEETKEQEKQKIEQQKQLVAKVKESVKEYTELFPGIKLTPREKEELTRSLLEGDIVNNKKTNIVLEKRNEDPILFEAKLKYFVKKGFFDKESKNKTIEKEITKGAINKLQEALQRGENNIKGQSKTYERNTTVEKDMVESMKKLLV